MQVFMKTLVGYFCICLFICISFIFRRQQTLTKWKVCAYFLQLDSRVTYASRSCFLFLCMCACAPWDHSEITWRNLTFTLSFRTWFWRAVNLKRRLAVVPWAMASDLDFSPPEVPEPTFLENLLRYGLFLGAIFQLICVLAIIVPIPKSQEAVSPSLGP